MISAGSGATDFVFRPYRTWGDRVEGGRCDILVGIPLVSQGLFSRLDLTSILHKHFGDKVKE